MQPHLTPQQPDILVRLPEVLRRFPVSKSAWWLGIKEQRYPAPVKISKRAVAWRASDIEKLIETRPRASPLRQSAV